MTKQLSRRQFLKAGGAGSLSLAFAPLLGEPRRPTQAPPKLPERVLTAAAQSPFQALPSSLPLGKPLADISMGWDGSVWGIDTDGVPHQYDQVAQTWQVYGSGFDAVGLLPDGSTVVAHGAEVSIDGAAPQSIASVWPGLPDSFNAGLDGIATAQKTLFMFRHCRFLTYNLTTNAPYDTPKTLTGWIRGWPTTTPAWQAGAIEAVGSNPSDINDPRVTFWTTDEFIVVDMASATVVQGPRPISSIAGAALSESMAAGFDAVLVDPDEPSDTFTVFQGPVQWSVAGSSATPVPGYAGAFSAPLAPTLAHAPSGITGALWAAGTGSQATMHDGDTWQAGPAPAAGGVSSITAGADGAVYGLVDTGSARELHRLSGDGSAWTKLATAPANAVQLSAGDAEHVWLRDAQNAVHRYTSGQFNAVNLGQPATHIAANADGTLWHAGTSTAAYRFISEGTAPSTVLPSVAGGTVVKVASTGFGSAFVLAQGAAGPQGTATTQFYDYASQYVFKTAAVYRPQLDFGKHLDYQALTQAVANGGHRIFVASSVSDSALKNTCIIVALDAQTGAELWPQPPQISAGELDLAKVMLVYDAALELVYVTGGTSLYALDAASGTQVWELNAGTNGKKALLGAPSLNAGLLCVTDLLSSKLLVFDTVATLARAKQQPHVPLWTTPLVSDGGDNFVNTGAAVFDPAGMIYLTVVDLQSRTAALVALNSADGSIAWRSTQLSGLWETLGGGVLDVLVGRTQLPGTTSSTTAALFVNVGGAIHALNSADGSVLQSWTGPGDAGTWLTSGMAMLGDRLYVGDSTGTLYVLDGLTLTLITKTGDAPQASWQGVLSRPALLQSDTAADGMAVCFTRGDENLWLFDPDTGTLEQVGTDQTSIGVLTYDATHGLLYGASWNTAATLTSLGQLFAVRPDQLIQDARAFIVESQLMQDYGSDAEAATDGVARYQTHVTVVDINKAARANQSVKLWADADGTVVWLDGTQATIGPQTPALFTTDGTGSFTITSTAGDLQTTTLQIWAPFMDPTERITIVPDAEFHTRLATVTATGATDPRKADLLSATSYDSTALFASNQGQQAQQAQQSVTQLAGAVGMGGQSSAAQRTRARANASTAAPRYTAYPALPGMRYTPVSVAYTQAVVVGAPLAFSFDGSGNTALTPAAAAHQIDGMEGAAPAGAVLGGGLSSLRAAWDEIKRTGATDVTSVVSVGKQVYAGIQYVANGITKVVKAVVRDIKDAVAAIGSFFVALGKVLLKVVEALSVLLHLGEVVATAHIISNQVKIALGGLTDILKNSQKPLDEWFANAEINITNQFCALYGTLGLPKGPDCGGGTVATAQSTPLSGFSKMGATPTTVYNTGQAGQPSQAVQCGWSSHTLRANLQQATPIAAASGALGDQVDEMTALFSGFMASLEQNPQLKAAYAAVGQAFHATFKPTSLDEFLAMAVETLLEIFKAIAITGVAVGQALVDLFLASYNKVAMGLQNLGDVTIPILSALWQKLNHGAELSILDLMAFVIAFPVTMLYRAVEGSYPSAAQATAVGSGSSMTSKVIGYASAFAMLNGGVLSGFIDAAYATNSGKLTLHWLLKANGALLLIANALQGVYTAVTTQPLAIALATMNTLTVVMAICGGKDAAMFNIIFTIQNLGIYVDLYLEPGQSPLTFSREVISAVPAFANPTKFLGGPVGYIAAGADVVCRTAAADIQVFQTIESSDAVVPVPSPSPAPSRYTRFLPWVRR